MSRGNGLLFAVIERDPESKWHSVPQQSWLYDIPNTLVPVSWQGDRYRLHAARTTRRRWLKPFHWTRRRHGLCTSGAFVVGVTRLGWVFDVISYDFHERGITRSHFFGFTRLRLLIELWTKEKRTFSNVDLSLGTAVRASLAKQRDTTICGRPYGTDVYDYNHFSVESVQSVTRFNGHLWPSQLTLLVAQNFTIGEQKRGYSLFYWGRFSHCDLICK